MRSRRFLAAGCALVAVVLAGCGSTVPISGRAPASTDGLGTGGIDGSDRPGSNTSAAMQGQAGAVSAVPGTAAGPGGTDPAIPAGPAPTDIPSVGQLPAARAANSALAPVQIGILTQSSSGEAAAALGLNAADNGDESAFARIVVEDVNARGGLGGRRLVPVIYNIETSEYNDNVNSIHQRACARFTQDNHVIAAVVSWHARGVHGFEACMEKARAMTIDPNGQITGDTATVRQFPHYVTPNGLGIDRVAARLPAAAGGRAFFGREKIGVLAIDTTEQHRAVDGRLRPELKRIGAQDPNVVYLTPTQSLSDAGRLSNEIANAVLRFQTEDVTRVIDLSGAVLLFATQAESQRYRPRYALTSGSAPAALTANGTPPEQLRGSAGIGWMPIYDVNELRPAETPPGQQSCLDLMRRKGQQLTGTTVVYTALTYCEQLRFLKALADQVPASVLLNGPALRNALGRVAGYPSALAFGTNVSLTRRDGAAGYRTFAFDDACECFRYTTSQHPT